MAAPVRQDRNAISVFAALVAVSAFVVATIGVIVAVVAEPDASSSSGGNGAPIAVSLTEFAITPSTINAAEGEVVLEVTNDGTMVHNLQVTELDLITPDLNPGESATLDLGELEPGTYKVVCTIAGHEASGMVGTLVVGEGGGTADLAAGGGSLDHDFEAAETAQLENMDAYLAAAASDGTGVPTEGEGNLPLEPTIAADGAKEFTLTGEVISWEVEPGKFVEGWAFNGQIPGPWIRVEPNDLVRVKFVNNLPGVATDIHWHGARTRFNTDGVSPLTQPLVPGDGGEFTYEFRAGSEHQMAMYHPHMHGQEALPNGMYGVFQVGDTPLPRGRTISGLTIPEDLEVTQELPMVLNDAGTIGLTLNGKGYPATDPIIASTSDNVLIHYHNEGLLIHPMHLHQIPQLVVAKDGFPLDQPYWVDTLNVAPGERYSVLVMPRRQNTRLDIDGNVVGEGLDGAGIWAFHCHILNHAESDNGLFGMVTAFVVVPTEEDIAANPGGPPAELEPEVPGQPRAATASAPTDG